MSARAWVRLIGLLVGLSACTKDPTSRTQIVVIVDSDLGAPEQLDQLIVELDSVRKTDPATADLSRRGLPRSLGLVHSGGPLGPFVVTARGLLAGAPVVEQSARVSFIAERTLELRLTLTAACAELDPPCTGELTCRDGGCVARARDELPVFAGSIDAMRDAGGLPPDAGAASDAGATSDASLPDTDSAVPGEPDSGVLPPDPTPWLVEPFATVNASATAGGSARIDVLAADSMNQLHTAVNRRVAHFDGTDLAAPLELRSESAGSAATLGEVELRELAIDEANGVAYLATAKGLAVCAFSPSDGVGSCSLYTKLNGLPDDNVEAVVLVAGTSFASVVVTGGPKGLFVLSSSGASGLVSGVARLPDVKVHALVAIGSTVWIAAEGGLFAHDVGANTTQPYPESTGAPAKALTAIAADSDGSLWVGSPMGIGRFVPATASWTVWRRGASPPPGLVMNDVRAITVARGTLIDSARHDVVWIATGAGVSRFDPTIPSFTTFTAADGLPSNSVQSVAVLPNGTKVFGTMNGAALFNGP